jgi:hypothetical protein
MAKNKTGDEAAVAGICEEVAGEQDQAERSLA